MTQPMKKNAGLWFRRALPFLALATVLALAILWGAGKVDRRFDEEAWKAGDERERGRMVDDILQRKLLSGQNRAGVRNMLGLPLPTWSAPQEDAYPVTMKFEWQYVLRVSYDESGTVKGAELAD